MIPDELKPGISADATARADRAGTAINRSRQARIESLPVVRRVARRSGISAAFDSLLSTPHDYVASHDASLDFSVHRPSTANIVRLLNRSPDKGKESNVRYQIASHLRVALPHPPEGALKAYLDPFIEHLRRLGYSCWYIQQQASLAARFAAWFHRKGVSLQALTEAHATRYLRCRARRVLVARGHQAALAHLIDFLRKEGVVLPAREPPATPAQHCARQYEQYLRGERGLADKSVGNYLPFIHNFLRARFRDGPIDFSRLSARDVVRFVQRRACGMRTKSAKVLTSALRSFLRYARYRGEVTQDLAAAVPTVANWSMSAIPRAISAHQVRQLLNSLDRRTALGRRDYAIMLLLSRLGLRAIEVTQLELSDVNWAQGCVSVRGKCGQRNELPLPAEVGKALVAYLRYGRPQSASRRVFLRGHAPFRGLGRTGVGSIVSYRIRRAKIDTPTLGAHQFRHGLATGLLRQGVALSEIGEVLGHRSPETTKIYTKVDLSALRMLAQRWPGGVA